VVSGERLDLVRLRGAVVLGQQRDLGPHGGAGRGEIVRVYFGQRLVEVS
jgi:hypothetical protein